MGANKLAENTPNEPKIVCTNGQPKPKKLGYEYIKKASFGVCSPWTGSLHLHLALCLLFKQK